LAILSGRWPQKRIGKHPLKEKAMKTIKKCGRNVKKKGVRIPAIPAQGLEKITPFCLNGQRKEIRHEASG